MEALQVFFATLVLSGVPEASAPKLIDAIMTAARQESHAAKQAAATCIAVLATAEGASQVNRMYQFAMAPSYDLVSPVLQSLVDPHQSALLHHPLSSPRAFLGWGCQEGDTRSCAPSCNETKLTPCLSSLRERKGHCGTNMACSLRHYFFGRAEYQPFCKQAGVLAAKQAFQECIGSQDSNGQKIMGDE